MGSHHLVVSRNTFQAASYGTQSVKALGATLGGSQGALWTLSATGRRSGIQPQPAFLSTGTGKIAGAHSFSGIVTAFGAGNPAGNFTDQYALFRFTSSIFPTGPLYGRLELSSTVGADSLGPDAPTVTISGWAYDDSGAQILAGSVPEPSTMALTGLAALALGATGLRRWRAARKPAA